MTFKIYCRLHVKLAAELLRNQLRELGHSAELVDSIDANDDSIYIIYCAFCANAIPKNYIIYQTEVRGSVWFSEGYKNTLKGALQIWDYDPKNAVDYKGIFVPPSATRLYSAIDKDIDILFYGSMNDRRKRILHRIGLNVVAVENLYGDAMGEYLFRAKTVINLHFSPTAPLEVFRCYEALSHGCYVISEPSDRDSTHRNYNHILFAETAHDFRVVYSRIMNGEIPFPNLTGLNNIGYVRDAVAQLSLTQ